ncbi:MAG TPA: sigma-70 family RNA polymerase sigma factor [Solirubrobacteraceae bacterium]|jgi:RNA polymerase sigma factor (sigma-70 family)
MGQLIALRADPAREMTELYTQLDGPLRRIVGSNVRAPAAVIEDACQVAWSRLLRRRGTVCREATLSWLVTTATREALRLLRRADRELPLEALSACDRSQPCVGAPPEQVVELRARLDDIAALPPRQQRLVWLQGLGFSYAEMSGATGASLRAVERHLLRAKQALRSA